MKKLFIFSQQYAQSEHRFDYYSIFNKKSYMSRWDEPDNDSYSNENMLDSEKEAQLLKKFNDYRELEKNEVKKRNTVESGNKTKPGIWTSKFIVAAIIQVVIITGLTIFLLATQFIHSEINFMQLLTNSFDGTSKWFFFGYIMYMTLVVGVAVTAILYNHVEMNLKKQFRGFRNILSWIHLLGMNVGGTASLVTLMWIGLQGSGISNLLSYGAINAESQNQIMEQFSLGLGIFISIFAFGIIAGVIAFLTTYFQKFTNFSQMKRQNVLEYENIKTEFEKL